MTHYIIGYGSLLSDASLKRTCPNSEIQRPVWVHDWQRHGELPSRNNAHSPEPFTVMNIVQEKGHHFNGVLLAISDEDLPALQRRECMYTQMTVLYSEDRDQTSTHEAAGWCGDPNERQSPRWEHERQWEYVLTCMQGAHQISPAFLNDFLETTFMDGTSLARHPHTTELLQRLSDLEGPTSYGYQSSPER